MLNPESFQDFPSHNTEPAIVVTKKPSHIRNPTTNASIIVVACKKSTNRESTKLVIRSPTKPKAMDFPMEVFMLFIDLSVKPIIFIHCLPNIGPYQRNPNKKDTTAATITAM